MNQEQDIFLENNLVKKDINLMTSGDEKDNIKKPFRKTGIFVIVISVICLILLSQIPWVYVNYDSGQNEKVEEMIYKDAERVDLKDGSFFESINGSENVGIFLDDIASTYSISLYIFIGLFIIGLVLTLYQIITRNMSRLYDLDMIVNSLAIIISAIICIAIILIFIKFIGAHLLYFHNSSFILDKFPNLNMIMPLPFIMIMIMASFLKVCFTLFEINVTELEKMYFPDSEVKAIYSFKQGSWK